MKILIIMMLSASLYSQSFDSPRNLVNTDKKVAKEYTLYLGGSYKFHNTRNEGLLFYDEVQSGTNVSTFGIAARVIMRSANSNSMHGLNLNINYGQVNNNFSATLLSFDDRPFEIKSVFTYNLLNLDLTYHYYFIKSFSLLAGPSLYYVSDISLEDRVDDNKENNSGTSVNAFMGAEYSFNIFSLKTSIAVIYSLALSDMGLENVSVNSGDVLTMSDWKLDELLWRVNLSYPIKL